MKDQHKQGTILRGRSQEILEDNKQDLTRPVSADRHLEKHDLSRFIKKYGVEEIAECESKQEEDGYLSDPT